MTKLTTMAKRFKLRFYRVITTTFQSCRSKHPSILPEDPVPTFSKLTNPNDEAHHRRRTSFKHHLSSAIISIGTCGKQTPHARDQLNGSQEFKWQKEKKWHVVAKIYDHPSPRRKMSTSSDDNRSHPMPPSPSPPPPPPPAAVKKKKRGTKKKKMKVPGRLRISTSSAESGWFSSEGGVSAAICLASAVGDERDKEETETLVSSNDSSSELNNPQLHTIKESYPFTPRRSRRTPKPKKRRVSRVPPPPPAAEVDIPTRLSVFKKLIPCTVDGKMKESFAIVKRSEDPYEDFKNSMMDMIFEKEMFDKKDLEQLLQCFLSLNSRNYHGVIVEAFSEIWECIFSPSASGIKLDSGHKYGHRVCRPASF